MLDAVRRNIMPHECTIILTSFVENNPVLDVLREEQYQIYVRENENLPSLAMKYSLESSSRSLQDALGIWYEQKSYI